VKINGIFITCTSYSKGTSERPEYCDNKSAHKARQMTMEARCVNHSTVKTGIHLWFNVISAHRAQTFTALSRKL
jgi:hypothetical protein